MKTKPILMAIVIALGHMGLSAAWADPASERPATRPAGAEREGRRGGDERLRAGRDPSEESRRPGRFRDRDDRRLMLPPPRPEDGPGDEPLSSEDVERVMETAREHFPELHQRLEHLRERDEEAFMRFLLRARGPLASIVHRDGRGQRVGPRGGPGPMIRMEMELRRLARDYHAARTDDERDAIRREMRQRLAGQVEARLEQMRQEIEEAEERLRQARQDLAEREENRNQFIRDRLERLLAEPDDEAIGPGRGQRRFRDRDEPGPPRGRDEPRPPRGRSDRE